MLDVHDITYILYRIPNKLETAQFLPDIYLTTLSDMSCDILVVLTGYTKVTLSVISDSAKAFMS